MTSPPAAPGGFIPPPSALPSPAPSTTSFSTSTTATNLLPHPRSRPLRSGSGKEEAVRRFVEQRLLWISRRFTKKFHREEDAGGDVDGSVNALGDEVRGYEGMREVCGDVEAVLDVLWLCGTPSLQIPYLLNIAGALTTYMAAFPPAPTDTFRVLRKLDHAFASLLGEKDVVSGEGLPGFGMEFGGRSGMSRTDMVRCRSLVESTRILVVDVMSRVGVEGEGEQETDDDEVSDASMGGVWNGREDEDDEEDEGYEMDVARVYEKTLTQLGQVLGDLTQLGDSTSLNPDVEE